MLRMIYSVLYYNIEGRGRRRGKGRGRCRGGRSNRGRGSVGGRRTVFLAHIKIPIPGIGTIKDKYLHSPLFLWFLRHVKEERVSRRESWEGWVTGLGVEEEVWEAGWIALLPNTEIPTPGSTLSSKKTHAFTFITLFYRHVKEGEEGSVAVCDTIPWSINQNSYYHERTICLLHMCTN